uniref:Uncharacterized protein n=1 Tax=Arundo donax TaxID=35708 RepID=A0A0A9DRV8_ARUDO
MLLPLKSITLQLPCLYLPPDAQIYLFRLKQRTSVRVGTPPRRSPRPRGPHSRRRPAPRRYRRRSRRRRRCPRPCRCSSRSSPRRPPSPRRSRRTSQGRSPSRRGTAAESGDGEIGRRG